MYDVVALGELLIDFIENGRSEQNNPLFEANPGGAPLQCAGNAAKSWDIRRHSLERLEMMHLVGCSERRYRK